MVKGIILILMLLVMLTGCGGKDEPTCDYKPFIDQNTNLMNQNTKCQEDKNQLNLDVSELTNTNNQLKIQILNNNITNSPVSTSCTTCTRLLNDYEDRLEDCWRDSNGTVEYTNYTYFNETLYDMWEECDNTLIAFNESLQ